MFAYMQSIEYSTSWFYFVFYPVFLCFSITVAIAIFVRVVHDRQSGPGSPAVLELCFPFGITMGLAAKDNRNDETQFMTETSLWKKAPWILMTSNNKISCSFAKDQ
jgi:hypothetical protein